VDLVPLEMSFGRPLPRHPKVVHALVAVRQTFEDFDRLFEEPDLPRPETIGHGEAKDLQRLLVRRVDREHVVADALGLLGLIEVSVVRSLDDRRVQTRGWQPLQLARHLGPPSTRGSA
jgi:hypothetical protein